MSKHIQKALPELVEAGILSKEDANRVRSYYDTRPGENSQRLFAIFGVIGALLAGLGLILLIAHNWETLSKPLKLTFAFLPLLVGQGVGLFAIWKRSMSLTWRESSSTYLFFALAASLSLVSQIYHIPGETTDFIFSWMLLALPMAYIFPSSMVSVLYIGGITYLGLKWGMEGNMGWPYFLMLLGILPFYLVKQQEEETNFQTFHHYILPLSIFLGVFASLQAFESSHDFLIPLILIGLLGLFQAIGSSRWMRTYQGGKNGYRVFSFLGLFISLFIFSFPSTWKEVAKNWKYIEGGELLGSEMTWIFMGILLLFAMLTLVNRREASQRSELMQQLFLPVFLGIYGLGMAFPMIGMGLTNLLILLYGIAFIREGARREHLGILNIGLLLITGLVICRFFDEDISFVLRGLSFLILGVGFFTANYMMYRRIQQSK